MPGVLVDSNIIIDILTENEKWGEWSVKQIENLAESNVLYINPIIFAEISIKYENIEDLKSEISDFINRPLSDEMGFLAGKAFQSYRKKGGLKTSPLPDFFIGAHAAIEDLMLVTRDSNRYAAYFPTVKLISPSG